MSTRRPTKQQAPKWVELVRQPQQGRAPYGIKIDVADLPVYRRGKGWHRHQKGIIRYPSKKHHRGSILLHRAILKLPKNLYVVFRNDDPFDVRRSNMQVITYMEQRQKPKKNPSIRTFHEGRPSGVSFPTKTYQWRGGPVTIHRYARAGFCFRRKEQNRSFNIDKLGIEEAVRRALAWRVQMIREHGMEPNAELLEMLERVTRMAGAGGGHDELFGGNAEYKNSRVQPWEVHHAYDNNLDP